MSRTFHALAAAVFLLSIPVHSQKSAAEPVDLEMVTRIREEGLHRSQVMDTARHLTDVLGPRVTGSPQLKAANEWTRQRLAEWGLREARLDPYPFGRGWSFSRTAVHMLKPHQTPLSALPKAYTPGTDGPVRGTVIVAKIAKEEDFAAWRGKLAGKIVLLDEPPGPPLRPRSSPASSPPRRSASSAGSRSPRNPRRRIPRRSGSTVPSSAMP